MLISSNLVNLEFTNLINLLSSKQTKKQNEIFKYKKAKKESIRT